MLRNVESHFSEVPSVDISRSIFDRSSGHKTSGNVGDLIPFYIDEVLPGDTFRVTTSIVARLQTMLTPIMDNLFLDTYYFFVPNRIVWDHWKEFCGENNTNAWIPPTAYSIPKIAAPSGGFATGTIADYLGLPVGVNWNATDPLAPTALPFRALAKICNDFFRDENVTDPLSIYTGDSNVTGSNGSVYQTDVALGGMPFKAAKVHDYFTSCLPSPQKGLSPQFNLINGSLAPVITGATPHSDPQYALSWINANNGGVPATGKYHIFGVSDGSKMETEYVSGATYSQTGPLAPNNLWADLSTSVGAVTINELRLAFQLQRYYERLARSGSRYVEWLKGQFGVTAFDSVLQRPEYLGGHRIPIQIHQVANSAQTANDYLGDVGALSVTSDVNEDFEKSFTEHGYVIGVMVMRYEHTYSQGLERFWSRTELTDFYLPVFANIGEQPVRKAEIMASATNIANKNDVFGYQEAWADYRYKPSRVSGEMRPGVANTLASWHLADLYSSVPTLSDSWIREDKANVDRVLAVQSSNANQFFADIFVKNIATRCMPMYSVPGLIDHN